MKRWYVVQTKSNQEALAVRELKKQNFNIFYPSYTRSHTNARTGRETITVLPLFPSYLFVAFDITRHRRWRAINGTRGVQGLIGCTENYLSPLPKGCVEELIKRFENKGEVTLEETVEQLLEFQPGMQLEIKDSNFKGLVGTYCSSTEKRVSLLITLLQKPVRVILPIESVRLAKPTS